MLLINSFPWCNSLMAKTSKRLFVFWFLKVKLVLTSKNIVIDFILGKIVLMNNFYEEVLENVFLKAHQSAHCSSEPGLTGCFIHVWFFKHYNLFIWEEKIEIHENNHNRKRKCCMNLIAYFFRPFLCVRLLRADVFRPWVMESCWDEEVKWMGGRDGGLGGCKEELRKLKSF